MYFSKTARQILTDHHEVCLGLYSYAVDIEKGAIPRGTIIGRYCSIAAGLNVFRRNHPIDSFSQHPFFYNAKLGLVSEDTIPNATDNPLTVGDDVWIGARVTILPNCRQIGDGAVIGAATVVTKDVPAHHIVAGNPARKIGERGETNKDWCKLTLPELLAARYALDATDDAS